MVSAPLLDEAKTSGLVFRNLCSLEARLRTINGRAEIIGIAPIAYRISRESDPAVPELFAGGDEVRYQIAIEPRVSRLPENLEFLGITGSTDGPGDRLPAVGRCDHCFAAASALFCFRGSRGNEFRIGGPCLSAFIGEGTSEQWCNLLRFEDAWPRELAALASEQEASFHRARPARQVIAVRPALALACCALNLAGLDWDESIRVHRAAEWMRSRLDQPGWQGGRLGYEEADRVLEWVREKRGSTSEGERHFALLLAGTTVGPMDFEDLVLGVARLRGSMPRPGHAFFGELGGRYDLDLEVLHREESRSPGIVELLVEYLLADSAGRRFSWLTSEETELGRVRVGVTIRMRATVKKHIRCKAGPLTVLTRCAPRGNLTQVFSIRATAGMPEKSVL